MPMVTLPKIFCLSVSGLLRDKSLSACCDKHPYLQYFPLFLCLCRGSTWHQCDNQLFLFHCRQFTVGVGGTPKVSLSSYTMQWNTVRVCVRGLPELVSADSCVTCSLQKAAKLRSQQFTQSQLNPVNSARLPATYQKI